MNYTIASKGNKLQVLFVLWLIKQSYQSPRRESHVQDSTNTVHFSSILCQRISHKRIASLLFSIYAARIIQHILNTVNSIIGNSTSIQLLRKLIKQSLNLYPTTSGTSKIRGLCAQIYQFLPVQGILSELLILLGSQSNKTLNLN